MVHILYHVSTNSTKYACSWSYLEVGNLSFLQELYLVANSEGSVFSALSNFPIFPQAFTVTVLSLTFLCICPAPHLSPFLSAWDPLEGVTGSSLSFRLLHEQESKVSLESGLTKTVNLVALLTCNSVPSPSEKPHCFLTYLQAAVSR